MATVQPIHPWQVCTGTVTRVERYGLFVETEGISGLLRIPELTWGRIEHPSEVADVGERVRFLVFNTNDARERPNEQFNGSIKALDTRIRPGQLNTESGTLNRPLILIQLLQIIGDTHRFNDLVSPVIYVSSGGQPEGIPLLLSSSCVSEETIKATAQTLTPGMTECIPVWLAKEFLNVKSPDLHEYSTDLENELRTFIIAQT